MNPYRDLSFDTILRTGCRILDVQFSSRCFEQFQLYFQLLQDGNKKQNLSSLKKPLDVAVLHFLDSVTLLKLIPILTSSVLDIGTGAGFPGLVIKIVLPEINITLVEKNTKKLVFLKEATRALGISDVRFINDKIENFLNSNDFGLFDIVLTRALFLSQSSQNTLSRKLPATASVIRMLGPRSFGRLDVQAYLRPKAEWSGYLPFISAYRKLVSYSPTHFLP